MNTSTQDYIDACGITDNAFADALNELVVNLKAFNLWEKFDYIFPMCHALSLRNLKNVTEKLIDDKSGLDVTAVFNRGFNFTAPATWGTAGGNFETIRTPIPVAYLSGLKDSGHLVTFLDLRVPGFKENSTVIHETSANHNTEYQNMVFARTTDGIIVSASRFQYTYSFGNSVDRIYDYNKSYGLFGIKFNPAMNFFAFGRKYDLVQAGVDKTGTTSANTNGFVTLGSPGIFTTPFMMAYFSLGKTALTDEEMIEYGKIVNKFVRDTIGKQEMKVI